MKELSKAEAIFETIKNAINSIDINALNTINFGGYQTEVDGGEILVSWDNGDFIVGYDPHCLIFGVKEIARALPKAESDTPFNLTPSYCNGIIQLITIGDWCYDA
jgi:hypothetical protein